MNQKKIRLCNLTDYKNVGYPEISEENEQNNFHYCIDNYEGMVITSNYNTLTSSNLALRIYECDSDNSEGIKCAS